MIHTVQTLVIYIESNPSLIAKTLREAFGVSATDEEVGKVIPFNVVWNYNPYMGFVLNENGHIITRTKKIFKFPSNDKEIIVEYGIIRPSDDDKDLYNLGFGISVYRDSLMRKETKVLFFFSLKEMNDVIRPFVKGFFRRKLSIEDYRKGHKEICSHMKNLGFEQKTFEGGPRWRFRKEGAAMISLDFVDEDEALLSGLIEFYQWNVME